MPDTSAESARIRPFDRQRQLAVLASQRFDVLVIGGRERYYVAAWDAAQRAALRAGAALCHHHGVGLNQARFMAEALGPSMGVLASVKRAFDPDGILNSGKLGLPDAFGDVSWPHGTGRHAT